MRAAPRLVPALLAVTVLAGACGSPEPAAEAETGPEGKLGVVTDARAATAARGLCRILDEAPEDVARAGAIFYDRAHDALHVIAAAAEEVDRAAAARLLLAKERVEQDLRGTEAPAGFADDVAALLETTEDALRTLEVDVPACEP